MKTGSGSKPLSQVGQRRTQRRRLFVLAMMMSILAWLLTGCTKTPSLSETDNGKTIQVHVGEEIDLALTSNASTGFAWTIEKSNNALLTLKHSDYRGSSNVPGSSGTQTFTFMAKSPGTVTLQLKYWRSFEGDKSIEQRFAVVIQIQT
jgi:inhibitor of cysteine peptidase